MGARHSMLRRLIFIAGLTLLAAPILAHVGSPDVYFQGSAGPYRLVISIRTPQMIPGIAELEIRSLDPTVRGIRVAPVYIVGAGSKYPPPPEALTQSKNDPQYFSGRLWLMASGSWEVRVHVDGDRGTGEIGIPVPAAARRTLPMEKPLGALLFGLMLLLVIALVSIAAAAAREGTLPAGGAPTASNRRRAWIATGVGSVILVVALFYGNKWWNASAAERAGTMIYQRPPLGLSIQPGGRLALHVGDSQWHSRRPETVMTGIIPDHDHLMHLFLIRTPAMDRFYHLHPTGGENNDFLQSLPALPAGHYQLFADIVRASGFPDTLTGELDISSDVTGSALNGDDSTSTPLPTSSPPTNSNVAPLPDGGSMVWERDSTPITANKLVMLRFRVQDKDGKPANDLELYMGMPAHAAIVCSDFTVFAHIHPDGTVSMAALDLANTSTIPKTPLDASVPASMQGMEMGPISPEISFPYGFPKAGDYRMFVQVKRAGRVVTGVFDLHVAP